ncbi:CHT2 [Candida jiufengensis]|uniref:CHT2 n=1 Tax=Candida jiufengensis TaxID=497108 RepID=UPI0022241D46|nr:CHT2 [Candida jiufengensis]KAI5956368.1 CHT2 [Candida jiufengensis]
MLSTSILSLLATSTLAYAANNVALYWGQNGALGQERLSHYCDNSDADIVLLSFLNDFPDPTNVNFANQCGDTYPSGLLHCQAIGEDIKTCQSQGKKVLLSLGGAAGNYGFSSAAEATAYADTLWNKFGNGQGDNERPFDDAIVDGFDFDIELGSNTGYPELATALKSKFDSSKQYYLSASPQCVYPDAKVGELLEKVPLDYAFIQFYNNYCSIDGTFNYKTWSQFADSAPNSNIELFVGVPATDNINGYVSSEDLAKAIDEIKCDKHFGGVSLWDASGAFANVNGDGENYLQQVRQVLNEKTCSEPVETETETAAESSTTSNEPASESTTVNETAAESSTTSNKPVSASTTTTSKVSSSSVVTLSSFSSTGYQNTTTKALSSSSIAGGSVSITSSGVITTGAAGSSSSSSQGSNGSGSNSQGSNGSGSNSNGQVLSTVTDIKHTLVTITSCSENKCSKVAVETGVIVISDVHTVYTTYCPLTASEVVVPVYPKSESPIISIPSETKPGVIASETKPGVIASETNKVVAPSSSSPVESNPTVAAQSSSAPVVNGNTAAPSVTVATSVSKATIEGETETYTVELTSTIIPQPIPQASSSLAGNGNNGTVPVFEGSANNVFVTVPLFLIGAAVALF